MTRTRGLAALAVTGAAAAGLGVGAATSAGQEPPAEPAAPAAPAGAETTTTPTSTAPAPTPPVEPVPPPAPEVVPHDDRPHAGDEPQAASGGEQQASGEKVRRTPAKRTPSPERRAADRAAEQAERDAARVRRQERSEARERREAERDEDGARDAAGAPGDAAIGAAPDASDPGFALAVPGAAAAGVPDFFIEKFRIPPFLLPIYQAAGVQYGVRWELLAAINEIETDYGRNLNVSSAGALGWMQFMPATWKAYGVDGNDDGVKDPYNPVDAIFAAARYLKASGAEQDIRKAVFAYNHADWYVDSVLLRARLIAGLPADLIGSLTGLTEGRFPIAATTTYAGQLTRRPLRRAGRAAVPSSTGRRWLDLHATSRAPVVAVQDGVVTGLGRSKARGRWVRLRDVYGNTYTYAHLGRVARTYSTVPAALAPRRAAGPDGPADDAPPAGSDAASAPTPPAGTTAPDAALDPSAPTAPTVPTDPGTTPAPTAPTDPTDPSTTPAPVAPATTPPPTGDPRAPIRPTGDVWAGPAPVEPPRTEGRAPSLEDELQGAAVVSPVPGRSELADNLRAARAAGTDVGRPTGGVPTPATSARLVRRASEAARRLPEATPKLQALARDEARDEAARLPVQERSVATPPDLEALGDKERVFAHPRRERAFRAGGAEQLAGTDGEADLRKAPVTTSAPTAGKPDGRRVVRRLRVGSTVSAGTVLGRLGGTTATRRATMRFSIRPAGRGAPRIDPKPVLDGWKLLESTAVYRADGRNALVDDDRPDVGRILLESKERLIRRVLADRRIQVYPCGRQDIRAGIVDRRVLATLAFLSASGLKPTVTSLRCGHGVYTASGNVSHHTSGNAVDLGAVNGIPILGHQGSGSITDITIRRLLTLQGTLRPTQIISLMTFAGADNTIAMPDHADHIHLGWAPLGGSGVEGDEHGRPLGPVLRPSQWDDLIDRLNAIDLPAVATAPSAAALPVAGRAKTLRVRP